MISRFLVETDEVIPASAEFIDSDSIEWQSALDVLLPDFFRISEAIFAAASPFFVGGYAKSSIVEPLTYSSTGILVASYRLRPTNEYYESLKQPIPSPENRSGPFSAGIELSIKLLRSFESKGHTLPSKIAVELEICGILEREGFGQLFADNRREIGGLVDGKRYEFYTPVPFDNVNAYRGKALSRQLSLYFENLKDEENTFMISRELVIGNEFGEAVEAIIPLAILYQCAIGYCQRRKDRGRLARLSCAIRELEI